MKALVRSRYGEPEVLSVKDVPEPVLREDEALIRVRAVSLNAADVDLLKGVAVARIAAPFRPANRILGSDVAGRVEAVGAKVTLFEPGDEVYGDTFEHGFGGLAQMVAVPEEKLSPIPLGLSAEQAATLPQAGLLAWQGLTGWGGVQPRQRVLINGGGGGVGTFAIQLAKALGAVVIGVDSAAKLDLMRSLGADEVIDYTEDDFTDTEERYERVLDTIMSRSTGDAQRALTPKGLYVVVGAPLRRLMEVATLGTVRSATSGAQLRLLMWRSMDRVDMARLESVVAEGTVRPIIERSYQLEEASNAFERLARGEARGNLIVTMERFEAAAAIGARESLIEAPHESPADPSPDAEAASLRRWPRAIAGSMTLAAALALSVPVAQTLAQPTAETAEAGSIATGQPVAYQSLDGSESLLITVGSFIDPFADANLDGLSDGIASSG